MPPEARLVRRIMHLIEEKGGRPFKIVGDPEGHQEAGIPDILFCYQGYFGGLEVKQPGAKSSVSPRQEYVLKQIVEAGGVGAVVTSVGQVAHILAKLDRKR